MVKLLRMKMMLLLCALVTGSSAWADTSTLTFTAACGGSGTADDGAKWTVTSDANESNFASDGIHYGTNSASVTYVQLATSDISGTVSQVVVRARDARASATISVTVGGTAFKCSGSTTATNTSADFIFTGSGSGEIVVKVDRGSSNTKALYVKSVAVTYSSGGGGSSVVAPSFSPVAGAVAAGTTVELSSETVGANIYYTLTTDGTDPTAPTSSSTAYANPITITTATKIKAIAIKGDDVSSISSASYTITVTAPDFNLASSGNYLPGTGLTLTSAGNTIYYNLTTDGGTPSDPTSGSTEYTGPIYLSSGTVKIKAIAYDTYGNASTIATRTINGIDPTTLPFNWAGGSKSNLTKLAGVIGYGLGSDYNDTHSPYLVKFDNDDDYIELFTNSQPLKVSVGVKMIGGGTTSKIKVQESTNGVEFSDVEELTISGAQNDVVNLTTSQNFASSTRVIKLLFVKGSNVGVGPISIAGGSLSATLNASGYATFASSFALDFSDDSEYSAWQITGVSGETITFSQITGTVAAGTGVLLKGTASETINIPVAASGTDISGTNKLVGTTTSTEVTTNEYYGLSGNQFVKVNAGTVPAGKALLSASLVSSVASRLTFVFEGEATGIQNVNVNANLNKVYDLQGRRVAQPKQGLYIKGGKKYVVK